MFKRHRFLWGNKVSYCWFSLTTDACLGKTKEVSSWLQPTYEIIVQGEENVEVEKEKWQHEDEKRERWTNGCQRYWQIPSALSHVQSPSSSPSHHPAIITPFQHHCTSHHQSISYKIIDKPPFIHLTLSISAISLPLPICSSISLPSGSLQSVCPIVSVTCVSTGILTY